MGILINIQVSPPNQRLNLTEPAVDDFARAQQTATIGLDIPRAEKTTMPTQFPPQVIRGPLGGDTKLL